MSAITAIYYRDGKPLDCSILDRMTTAVAHRGLDGAGTWCEGQVGLGHRQSWTTPQSPQERMPLASRTGDLVVTADARIDNRDELLSAFGWSDPSGDEIPDSQLILAAYEQWGWDCPTRLLGDFAFAIWDRRQQLLFCARDPIGVKPLYYFLSGNIFVVASEIKALLCVEGVPHELNERRMADHVLSAFEDNTATFYRDIFRLQPAHSLVVAKNTMQMRRYWALDPSRELRLGSAAEYAEAFREIFTASVGCRLRSAFPVGSSLSGGLDSSSIACTARDLLKSEGRPRLHTYSAIFPGLPHEDLAKIDERKYVDAVLSMGDLEPHFVRADRLGPLTDLERVLWHQDEAFLAPNLYIHWAMYKAAQKDGVRVFLDGLDGDTTVSHGLEYLSELLRRGRLVKLFREASGLSQKSPNRHFTRTRILWQYAIRDLISGRTESFVRRLLRKQRPIGLEASLISPAFAARLDERDLCKAKGKQSRTGRTAREKHAESLSSMLIPYTLELADRAAAAFGIECRYPFFDRRLVEFCLSLPSDQKLNDGWTRAVLRRAMTGILPHRVQWRVGKANLSPNFRRRLLDYGRPTIEQILESPGPIESFLDIQVLRDAYRRYASRPLDGDEDAMTVYGAVILGAWLRGPGFASASHDVVSPNLAADLKPAGASGSVIGVRA